MKELNTFRKFLAEGADDSYYAMTKAKRLAKKDGHDFDKLPKFARGKGVAHQQKYLDMAKKDVSENALGVDKGDGTFEITADIDIMGKKFNFSDICPGAHNAIKDLADEYENNPGKLGDVLFLANLHQNFFNLERKALGPQGIDADELNKIKQLYVEILNIAVNSFGTDTMQEMEAYMNMHMDKIKKAGLKASEPGGSSDTSYAQDWADEQDAMYGKANFVEEEELKENDKALDEILNEE